MLAEKIATKQDQTIDLKQQKIVISEGFLELIDHAALNSRPKMKLKHLKIVLRT